MKAAPTKAKVLIESVSSRISLESALVSFSNEADLVVLDSAAFRADSGRYSILACDPVQVLTVPRQQNADPFAILAQSVMATPSIEPQSEAFVFYGGWIGYITYEAGLAIEGIPSKKSQDLSIPRIRFGLYDTVVLFDHLDGTCVIIAVDWPRGVFEGRLGARQRLEELRGRLESCTESGADLPASRSFSDPVQPIAALSDDEYRSAVQAAKRYIEDGDIYQVNLTQRFSHACDAHPVELYLRLRQCNPGSYAALIQWQDYAIHCSSPELFLELIDGHVQTRPIKGTKPRSDQDGDDAGQRALASSDKDRAELNMIVDLLRNDLGRVCQFGSIHVVDPGAIEEHPTVLHRVATIEATLDPEKNWADLLRATFPGGSITGAPKIRAMQIIEELEPTPREVYCGAIGWIGLDGSMCLNVAIRTMLQVNHRVHVYAGGAIVADSTVEDEYRELLAKARGMFRALRWNEPVFESNRMGAAVS